MFQSPLEFLADRFDNVVKFDAQGRPSIFVKFPKMTSKELDDSLPNHTHPAFVINGVEQDFILIGKYKASEVDTDGTLYSIPGVPPKTSATYDTLLSRMRSANPGASGMTIADAGFLLLLAQKHGWNAQRGNNEYGSDNAHGHSWKSGITYAYNTYVTFEGWLYRCLIGHVSSASILPGVKPNYWERIRFVGGTPYKDDFSDDETYPKVYRTLTGSGPVEWYFGEDESSICEPVGTCFEYNYGYRVVNSEIQIIENNNAADPEADLSSNSAAWKAIKPHSNDDGYDLVAPGTTGTLHWKKNNSGVILDTTSPVSGDSGYVSVLFRNLSANTTNLPYIPSIVRELGIFPTSGSVMRGNCDIPFFNSESLFCRGNSLLSSQYNFGEDVNGFGNITYISRGSSNIVYGARLRCVFDSEMQPDLPSAEPGEPDDDPDVVSVKEILNMIGKLSELDTTDKTNLVNAINEVLVIAQSGGGARIWQEGDTLNIE